MTPPPNRRKLIIIALAATFLLLFAALATLNAFRLNFLNPSTTFQTFFFTGLSTVAFLLFIAALILLVRNVLKIYADQRSRVLGARLRTRMLWGAVLVSLLPLVFMFAFSYLLMNRAVDRWFSQPVNQLRDDSNRMALQLAQYTTANARVEAESIATEVPPPLPQTSTPPATTAPRSARRSGRKESASKPRPLRSEAHASAVASRQALDEILRRHEITLQNGFAVVYRNGRAIAGFQMPQSTTGGTELKTWIPERSDSLSDDALSTTGQTDLATPSPAVIQSLDAAILAAAQRNDQPIFSTGSVDYALGTAALKQGGTVVVGVPVPFGLSATMAKLHAATDAYWTLFRSRRQIRNLYTLLLLMMTGLALFACTWLALHLSKQVTKPVEALADAMDLIAAGDYGHRVAPSATEELGELVLSFNRMAADLENSRLAVSDSNLQLSAANTALEARRSELETMLETIPNGVATLSPDRRILTTNRSLSEMIDPGGQQPFSGRTIAKVLPPEVTEAVDRLIRRSHRMGSASTEIELSPTSGKGGATNLLATVALLESAPTSGRSAPGRRDHLGYVLVLENATELLRAQKQSAWKEVARRVAHEIKNPLTPISLSAEQTRRHIDRLSATLAEHGIDSPSVATIRRCSETISSSVESMRSLVDQFSALAEFPTAQPHPADLNTIVENSLALFAGRLQNIRIVRNMSPGLPLVLADPEALKRALSNLIDNAAEAMQTSLLRELQITTALLDSSLVELTVADTGAGLTDDMRERLFLPYFSTKQRGTGLGLAIAAKIVQEHGGTIRAEKNSPVGARFIVELRPAAPTDSDPNLDPLPNGSLLTAIGDPS
ncbi:MAG: hypothetical protein NVSMB3_09070 [Acidobacteriaceae bacterium]